MSSERTIACAGNITLDTLFWVDHLPAVDDVATVRATAQCVGGRGAIVAAIVKSLGCKVVLVTSVPRARAQAHADFFNMHGLTGHGLTEDPEASIYSRVFVTIGAKEQNCTSLFLPGDITYRVTDSQRAIARHCSILYLGTHDIGTNLALVEAVALDSTVIVSPTTYMLSSAPYRAAVFSRANVLVGNALEFCALQKRCGATLTAELFQAMPKLKKVFVTLGDRGSMCLLRNGASFNTSAKQAAVRTPVGVGDAFAAGIVYGEATDRSPQMSAELGSVLASCSIESHETCPSPQAIRHAGAPILTDLGL